MEFVFYDLFTYRSKEFYKYTLYIFSRMSRSRFTGTNKNHIERSFLHCASKGGWNSQPAFFCPILTVYYSSSFKTNLSNQSDKHQRALDLRTRTSTRVNLKFLHVFSEKNTPESFILLFSPKKLVRLFILKEVQSSSDSKMMKLLTFDNLHFVPATTTFSLKLVGQ